MDDRVRSELLAGAIMPDPGLFLSLKKIVGAVIVQNAGTAFDDLPGALVEL